MLQNKKRNDLTNLAHDTMKERLDLDEIHRVLQWAAENLKNVEVSHNGYVSQPMFASNDVRYYEFGLQNRYNTHSFAPACFIDERPTKFKLRITLSNPKQTTTQLIFASKRLARSPPVNYLVI